MAKYATLVPMLSIEDVETNSQTDNGSGSEGSTIDEGIMLLTGTSSNTLDKYLTITSAEDLVGLSCYVRAEEYEVAMFTISSGSEGQEGSTTFDVVNAKVTDKEGVDHYFQGLGDANHPFKGTLKFAEGSKNITFRLNKPLFNYLADSASIAVNLYSGLTNEASTTALLAENIVHDPTATPSTSPWAVSLYAVKDTYSPSLLGTMAGSSKVGIDLTLIVGELTDPNNYATISSTSDYTALTILGSGYLCGTMEAGSSLVVNLKPDGAFPIGIPAVSSSGNAGGLVGTMGNNAQLSVTLPQGKTLPIRNVTAGGYAGGLVGNMSANAVVSLKTSDDVDAEITTSNVTISGNYAGGLVGYMEGATTLAADWSSFTAPSVAATDCAGGLVGYAKDPGKILQNIPVTGSATISGKKAGGLIGRLDNTKGASFTLNANVQNLTIKGSESAGGLFGELHNDKGAAEAAIAYSITQSDTGSISAITLTDGDAGGLIGKYYTDDLKNTLTVTDITVSSTASSATSYGGVIGNVDSGVAAYVEFSNVTTATSGNVTSYGGLIGSLKDSGHMVKVGTGVSVSGDFKGTNVGGLVGSMPSGVLYIANDPEGTNSFPQLSLTKLKENASATRGWILGNRGNTLVYTDIPNWSQLPSKSSDDKESNDTGVWGQVLRVDGALSTLLTLNETEHTVTVKAPTFQDESATAPNNSAKITSVLDFAAVALRLQLNPKGALTFDGGDFDSSGLVTISLSNSIDLNNTGLTGLTRDVNSNVNSTEVFNLTITGNSKTITLPDLKVYASGNGHDRQGLIGKAGELNFYDLTVSGNIKTHVLNGDIYAGALLAEASGGTTLTSVTSSIQMTISGGNSNNCAYSGLVAMTSSNVTFDRCKLDENSKVSDGTNKNSYAAGFLAYGKGTIKISVTSCELHGTVEKTVNPTDYARISGLITTLYDGNYTLNISGLTVSNLTVSVPDDFSKTCGGLLGYEWINTTATISGVTITGCTLKAGNAMFGGLVYKGSRYWKVGDGTKTSGNGISISNSSFSGKSNDSKPSGLLVCRANVEDDGKGALYLEILYNGYSIGDKVTVNLTSESNFDELVGTTEGEKGNGIVSIATTTDSPAKIDQKNESGIYSCNTYKNKIQQWNNPHTRYYYNLNLFRGATDETGKVTSSFGKADSAEKMVLWSAWDYCDSTLNRYFIKGGQPSIISGDLDLSGYSYYPVSITGSVTIENGTTITFDYEGLETAEATGANDGTENKKPSNENCQHYGMHTGLFTDVTNNAETGELKLTATNLTLTGTVGKSAIISGTANGKNQNAKTLITLTGVNLHGIKIYPAPTKDTVSSALLIQNIGDFSTLKMSGVKTRVAAGGEAPDYPNGTFAASSLIGKAGNDSGKHIQLEFSDMVLDGREYTTSATQSDVYGTSHSIFTHALFLMQFEYSDGNTCRGVYNFEKGVNHQYTLGQELSNTDDSTGISGRNNDNQFWFFRGGDNDFVCYEEQANSNPKTYFASGYLRYVNCKEGQTNTSHELDINVRKPTITSGCGTYSDPYIINSYRQLVVLAELLNSDSGTVEGMQVTLNVGDNGVIKSDNSFGPQNGHTAGAVARIPTGESTEEAGGTSSGESGNTSGESSNSSQNTSTTYDDCTDVVFTCENGTWTSEHTTVNSLDGAIVRTYLRNAYYMIDGSITLPSTWTGLGELSPEKAFSGVIVGKPGAEIHLNPNNTTFTQFGGLIKYSLGSVVKDVKIVYNTSITVKCDAAPDGTNVSFFGGVIGWCMGGDNIIDGVTVQFANQKKNSITGSTPYLAAIGGYVGLVGGTEGLDATTNGLGGGVVFRNFSGTPLSSDQFDKVAENSTYFYVNPYVGRVLDGYAMAEGDEGILNNTDKNYQIPKLTVSTTHLTTEANGTIKANDEQGLWLLSAIANSGAGNAANCKAYTYGKARTCDYDLVGSSIANKTTELYDERNGSNVYLGGDASNFKTTSYLTNNLSGFSTLTGGNAVSIVLENDCDMTTYGNGFRGIGTSYGLQNAANPRLIRISSLDGKNKTIILAQNRKEYSGEREKWSSIGSGLFILLSAPSEDKQITIKDLTINGSTGISYYENSTKAQGENAFNTETGRVRYVGAGALAANLASETVTTITINNVSLNKFCVNTDDVAGSTYAGGLIGAASYSGSSVLSKVELIDCKYNTLKVRGRSDVGGFLGYVCANTVTITYTGEASLNDASVVSTATPNIGYYYSGTGGLIGQTEQASVSIIGKVKPENETAMPVKFTDLHVESKYYSNTADKAQAGGLIGLLSAPTNGNVTIQNLGMEGIVEIIGGNTQPNTNAGGLVGALVCMKYDTNGNRDWNWNSGGSVKATISDVWIAQEDNSRMSVSNFRQGGGLIGILAADGGVTISNIKMGSKNGVVTIHNAYNKTAHCEGGFVGAVIKPKMNINNSQVTNTTVKAQYGTDRGSALLVGFSEKAGTIDFRNLAIERCNVWVGQKDFQSALLYGYLKDGAQTITGTNILARNCKMGYTTDWLNSDPNQCTKMGIWGGSANSDSDKTVYLVGMSLWNNTTPAKDFGYNTPKKSYVIRADYLADTSGTGNSAYPHVVTSPVKILTGIDLLTGDGIAFTKNDNGSETTTPMAQRIVENYLATDTVPRCQVYFNATGAMDYFCSTTNGSKAVNTSYFSTFHTAGENKFGTDFPVLVINSTEAKNAETIVKNYISLLTNAKSSLPTSIQATGYKWDTSQSSFVVNDDPSLTVNENKTITVIKDKYDNQNGQFTLLDVAYNDPAGTTDENGNSIVAYHLYIPVIVKRVLEFKFWASAENGTTYLAENYGQNKPAVIGSNMDQITALLTFEYQRTQTEWQAAVDNGENLLWNFDKEIYLDNAGSKMPDGTRLTLVDRNDQDKAYTCSYRKSSSDGKTISFSKFMSVSGSGNWSWSSVFLCDLLGLQEDATSSAEDAKYVRLDPDITTGATLRIGDTYYRPKTAEDKDEDTFCNITVTKTELVQETYYLTFQTPLPASETEDDIYNFYINCTSHLKNPTDENGNTVAGLPTSKINDRAGTKAENQVVIGNFFMQTFEVATNSSVLMSDNSNTISATLKTKIKFTSEKAYKDFNEYSGKLYHSFCINLKEYLPEASEVPFAAGTTIQVGTEAPKEIGDGVFTYWLDTGLIPYEGYKMVDGYYTKEISTDIVLTFTTPGILTQFPAKIEGSEENVGIRLNAASVLSMKQEALKRSNLRKSDEDDQYFYRKDISVATLSYNAYDQAQSNPQDSGLGNLGINGRLQTNGIIDSAALYNCSQVVGAQKATQLKLTLELMQKQDPAGTLVYNPVAISNYMNGITISAQVIGGVGTITDISQVNGGVATLGLSGYDGHSPIKIDVKLDVKTGADAEALTDFKYANYRVKLTAELCDETGTISGSKADDYIVYTNAKIINSLITTS